MFSVFSLTCVLILLINHSLSDLCTKCNCYPDNKPIQIFCENAYSLAKQNLTITDNDVRRDTVKDTLELLYIYGYNSVEFASDSLALLTVPVNIFIHHCSQVILNENSFKLIRSLTVANVDDLIFERNALRSIKNTLSIKLTYVKIKTLPFHSLYDISPLNILEMNAVSVQHIKKDAIWIEQSSTLKLQNCVVDNVESSAISIYGKKALLKNNLFKCISNGGISLYTENLVSITNCSFQEYNKSALYLHSPSAEISSNYFAFLPASALAHVNTNESINFTDNKIENIDLGGVLLDMDYERINFANNTINCDCSPKKTSLLIPKDTFPVYTQLEPIFYNNFCHANCTVSLKDLSYLLLNTHVCNSSTEIELTDGQLCNTSQHQEHSTITTTTSTSKTIIYTTIYASRGSLHTMHVNYKVVLSISVLTYIVRIMIT